MQAMTVALICYVRDQCGCDARREVATTERGDYSSVSNRYVSYYVISVPRKILRRFFHFPPFEQATYGC